MRFTYDALDAALRVARAGADYPTQLRMLEVALDGIVTRQEATNKTRKILTRIWINPPDSARPTSNGRSHNRQQGPTAASSTSEQ